MNRLDSARQINCLLVSGLDPLTRNMRTGAALRYANPPENVRYLLHKERLGYPKHLGHYSLNWVSVPLSSARLFAEAFFPLEIQKQDLVHSLFWSIHRYPLPWIHENDQSLGQYLTDYVKFRGTLSDSLVKFTTTMLNSEKCKAVIVWSNWAKKGYENDGVDQSKISVIPPPFTTSNDRVVHDSTNLLFIGRDYHRKGGDVALEVFGNLKKSHANIHMTFVGRIDDVAMLEKVKRDSAISYYDHVSRSDLHDKIFPSSDIFLLPTVAEAYGMSILEAMSKGIPVVTSNISAIPEVVENGVSGYLAPPGSVEIFTKKCALLLDSQERRIAMGEKARQRVAMNFSREKIGIKLYNLYLDCLS